jgi:hypothetical protein
VKKIAGFLPVVEIHRRNTVEFVAAPKVKVIVARELLTDEGFPWEEYVASEILTRVQEVIDDGRARLKAKEAA